MEPPYYFVRDRGSRTAHHWDYERDRSTRALCGHEYEDEIIFEGPERPSRVCRACTEELPRFEARWWRDEAIKTAAHCAQLQERWANAHRDVQVSRTQIEKLTYQLGRAEERIGALEAKIANQRKNLNDLQSARAAAKRAANASQSQSGRKVAGPKLPLIRQPTIANPRP